MITPLKSIISNIKQSPAAIKTVEGTNAEMLTLAAELIADGINTPIVFYNTDNKSYYNWNGTGFNGLNVDGKVKINGSGGVQPTFTLVANVPTLVDFGASALDLSASPVTQFPQNIISPTDADIWDVTNKTLIENTVLGQVHNWRVIFDYANKNLNDVASIDVRLKNPLNVFATNCVVVTAEGRTTDQDLQAYLTTIADANSLPTPIGTGKGYELYFESNKALDITVKSITRVSDMHSLRA